MSEPNAFLRWAMFHFAGGEAFLWGLAVFLLAQLGLVVCVSIRRRRLLILASRSGLIWTVSVLPPVSWWLLTVFAMALLMGIAIRPAQRLQEPSVAATSVPRRETIHRLILAACALVAIVLELPYRYFAPMSVQHSRLLVVGDSVTAGLNDGEDTWPQRLSRASSLQIVDASQPGATLRSAWKQVDLLHERPGLLLLEVGGNDLLEGLPVARFDHDLDQLLVRACQPGRTVWMFELPLPPLACRYGAAQRRLAKQYHVTLIPRRFFLQVLTARGATVDGIHLSEIGHQRMADLMQELLKPEDRPRAIGGNYRHVDERDGRHHGLATPPDRHISE